MPILNEVAPDEKIPWKNCTDRTMSGEIFISEPKEMPNGKTRPAQYLKICVEPGETVWIPASLTDGVQQYRNGVIVGGLFPMLTRVRRHPGDVGPAALHPSLLPTVDPCPLPAPIEPHQIAARLREVQAPIDESDDDAIVASIRKRASRSK